MKNLTKACFSLIVLALSLNSAFAGSGTWSSTPGSGDWNTDANWVPASAPNGSADTATFATSNTTAVSLSTDTEVNAILFNAGASAFNINLASPFTLTISGSGIANNSANIQSFETLNDGMGNHGTINITGNPSVTGSVLFTNDGSAASGGGGYTIFNNTSSGGSVMITNNGGTAAGAFTGGVTQFYDTSTAGVKITNNGAAVDGADGGDTEFFDTSSSGSATINNQGAGFDGSGGHSIFHDSSTSGSATIINSGGNAAATGPNGGYTQYNDSSTAGNATITNNGGAVDNSYGGNTSFFNNSTAANAQIINNAGVTALAARGEVDFYDSSTAASAVITNNGGAVAGISGGSTQFHDSSTSGTASVINNAGSVAGAFGGETDFNDSSNAGSASITNNGGTINGSIGGVTHFYDSSSAGSATITTNGGANGGGGGATLFYANSDGGTARAITNAGGIFDISNISNPTTSMGIGSIEGSGTYFLGGNNLTVGSNNLSTVVSGVISDGGDGGGIGGSLTKMGSGTLVLSGMNSYTGVTTINGGILLVNGSIASPSTMVNAGGTLGGLGTVGGDVTNSGVVSPGDAPGTLTITGSYTQMVSGSLTIKIGGLGAGQHDLLAVGGPASLNGTLQLVKLGNFTVHPGDKLTFLTAAGGVNGTFSSVNVGTIIDAKVIYDPNDVELEFLQGSFASFAALSGLTPNQFAVARNLDGSAFDPRANALIIFLDNEPLGNLPHEFDLIAPAALTSIFQISEAFADVQADNIVNHLSDERGTVTPGGITSLLMATDGKSSVEPKDEGGKNVATAAAEGSRWNLWAAGSGDWVRVDGDFNAAGYHFATGGVTLGADYRACDHFVAGIMGGYANTGATLTQNGSVDVESGRMGIYSTMFGSGFYLNTLATGGYNSYDTHRLGLGGIAQGSTDGAEFDGLIGVGYDIHQGNFTLGPLASVQYTYVSIDSFTENGSLAPLQIGSQSQDSLRTQAGFHISYDCKTQSGIVVTPGVMAAWQHEYLDSAFALDSQFASGAGNVFTVTGPNLGRDSVVVNAGVNVQWTPRLGTYVYYYGELGRTNYQLNSVNGGIRISF